MLGQTHPLAHFFLTWLQCKFYYLYFFISDFCFLPALLIFLPLCFQPLFTSFLQRILCKIDFFPFVFSLITLVSIFAVFTGIFIRIPDIPVFLDTFLPQNLSRRAVNQIPFRISDEISSFARSTISSVVPYTDLTSLFLFRFRLYLSANFFYPHI